MAKNKIKPIELENELGAEEVKEVAKGLVKYKFKPDYNNFFLSGFLVYNEDNLNDELLEDLVKENPKLKEYFIGF